MNYDSQAMKQYVAIKNNEVGWVRWLTPVIPALGKHEAGR